MNWSRRVREWIRAIRMAGAGNVPWFGMLMAVLSGPVPRSVWRARMRTCLQCPLYSKPGGIMLCLSTHPDMLGIGCKCYLPFKALAAAPHAEGCYGRTLADDLGWPVYVHPSLRARLWAPFRFLLGK